MKFLLSVLLALGTIEGVVQSISGDTLTVKTDDARISVVDVSKVGVDGVGLDSAVRVTGRFEPADNTFRATSIESRSEAAASPPLDGARR